MQTEDQQQKQGEDAEIGVMRCGQHVGECLTDTIPPTSGRGFVFGKTPFGATFAGNAPALADAQRNEAPSDLVAAGGPDVPV
jgi:hypothetical protein